MRGSVSCIRPDTVLGVRGKSCHDTLTKVPELGEVFGFLLEKLQRLRETLLLLLVLGKITLA